VAQGEAFYVDEEEAQIAEEEAFLASAEAGARATLYISKVDTTRFLGYSVGIGLLTTIVFYIIIMRVWNTITGFVRKHGQ
jgi:hypothetical protein